MSEGKFSQPRPHRDEERQIEESFRKLTEEKHHRKKVYTVEEDIGRTVQEMTHQSGPQPDTGERPFERSARMEQTMQAPPNRGTPAHSGQSGASQRPQTDASQAWDTYYTQPRQTPESPTRQSYNSQTQTTYDPQFRQSAPTHRPGYQQPQKESDPFFDYYPDDPKPLFPEEPFPEEEPDFIDKLMNLGSFFRKHQTPVILGLCAAAVLLIVLFVSIFFAGGKQEDPYGDMILPNVYIADIAVGGMTQNEAIAALKNATSGTYTSLDMVIDLSGTEIRLSPKQTKAELDIKAAVAAAYEYGRTGSKVQQEQAYQDALMKDHIIAALPYLNLDTAYIQSALNTYAEDSGSTLTQTSYGLEGDEPQLSADKFNEKAPTQTLVIVMGTPGIGFDAKDVYARVLDAYSLHQFLVQVENVQSVTEPDPIDLEKIYKEFYIEPVNASVNLQTFETKDGSYGYGFDLEAAQKLVEKAQPGEVLRIPMEYIPPEILDNDAFFKDTLGEHQTRGTGNDDRNKNLQLACAAIDGTILNPGESLSFSSLMTKVTQFRTAPEDTGREDVEQGGISQVASTLYYAALVSDLNIASRSNHSYLPSFIDYGLDATASLKISNTTGYPIQISAEYSGGYVKVKILGTEERDYYVMLDSSISSSTNPSTVYKDFPYDNEEGYEDGEVLEEGSAGYLVKSYKVKYDRKTGKELSRDFVTNSQYAAVDRVIARVEAPPETEPETLPPTEAPTLPNYPNWPNWGDQSTEVPTIPSTEVTEPSTEGWEETAPQEETYPSGYWPGFPFGHSFP